jgi:hypothetical protein
MGGRKRDADIYACRLTVRFSFRYESLAPQSSAPPVRKSTAATT